jgi:hypothetical protein
MRGGALGVAQTLGLDDPRGALGRPLILDGSRIPTKGGGFKNSLHLVFPDSPPVPAPTSAAADPDYPPLLVGRQVQEGLRPRLRDGKGNTQPDTSVYTTRRNMRLVGSCKAGQPVPLVPERCLEGQGGAFAPVHQRLQALGGWLRRHGPPELQRLLLQAPDDGRCTPNWSAPSHADGGDGGHPAGFSRGTGSGRRVSSQWHLLGQGEGLDLGRDQRKPALRAWGGQQSAAPAAAAATTDANAADADAADADADAGVACAAARAAGVGRVAAQAQGDTRSGARHTAAPEPKAPSDAGDQIFVDQPLMLHSAAATGPGKRDRVEEEEQGTGVTAAVAAAAATTTTTTTKRTAGGSSAGGGQRGAAGAGGGRRRGGGGGGSPPQGGRDKRPRLHHGGRDHPRRRGDDGGEGRPQADTAALQTARRQPSGPFRSITAQAFDGRPPRGHKRRRHRQPTPQQQRSHDHSGRTTRRHSSSGNGHGHAGTGTATGAGGGGGGGGGGRRRATQHHLTINTLPNDATNVISRRPRHQPGHPGSSSKGRGRGDDDSQGSSSSSSRHWNGAPARAAAAAATVHGDDRWARLQNTNGVIRNKAARAEMSGVSCAHCARHAAVMGLSSQEARAMHQNCSRHRVIPTGDAQQPQPQRSTPDGYWDTSFPETETQEFPPEDAAAWSDGGGSGGAPSSSLSSSTPLRAPAAVLVSETPLDQQGRPSGWRRRSGSGNDWRDTGDAASVPATLDPSAPPSS